MKKTNLCMIGHTLRHDSLLKLVIEGYVDEKTEIGGRIMEYISEIN